MREHGFASHWHECRLEPLIDVSDDGVERTLTVRKHVEDLPLTLEPVVDVDGQESIGVVDRRAVGRQQALRSQRADALERRELTLYYQPEVALATGEIVGFEALIRWRHPSGVWLLPEDFLPVAEASGLTIPIGRWALEEACRAASAWPALTGGVEPLTVSIDVAGGHFHHPDFVADVARALQGAGLAAEALRLEVTEPTIRPPAQIGSSW